MALSPADILRAASLPYDASTTLRTLDLTTSDATISLAAGVYDVFHDGASARAIVSLTGVTTSMPPATGAAEVTAFVVPAGSMGTFAITDTTTLHAKASASTATLYLVRKALS